MGERRRGLAYPSGTLLWTAVGARGQYLKEDASQGGYFVRVEESLSWGEESTDTAQPKTEKDGRLEAGSSWRCRKGLGLERTWTWLASDAGLRVSLPLRGVRV